MRFGLTLPERSSWFERHLAARHLAVFGIAWLVVLFVVPVMLLFVESLQFGGDRFGNYRRVFAGVWLMTLVRTLYYALVTTVLCLVLGYVFSYYVAFKTERRVAFLALVAVPLWVAIIVRYMGVALFFLPTGPVVQVFGTDFGVLFSARGVILGLTSALLPFAILPMYASLRSVDEELVQASRVLGAGGLRTAYAVVVPLSLPGIVAATLLVYILAAGSFLAPELLGGPGDFMAANVVGASGFGAAFAVVFTALLLVLVGLFNRLVDLTTVLGDL